MIRLQTRPSGVVLPIRAQPSARKSAVRGIHDGALKVSVTEAPEKGKANKAIVKLLSSQLGLKKSQLTLIAGLTDSRKELLVEGVDADDLRDRIGRLLADTEA